MTQLEHDQLALRCSALEARMRDAERAMSLITIMVHIMAGLVLAAMIVGALELRAIYHLAEVQQWRSR